MIRFKDRVFEDYFIDPVTAVITDKDGKALRQYNLHGYYHVCVHGIKMAVHRVQAHTSYGYIEGFHVHHIDENKENNSLSNLDYIPPSIHTKITWTGRHHSEETKQKMSNSMKGKVVSEEVKHKISEAEKGHIVSEETKQKISETWKKKVKDGYLVNEHPRFGEHNGMYGHSCFDYMTPEEIDAYRKNMSIATTGEKNGMYGKHHSDETRKKLSEANKGFHWYNNGVISIQSKVELSGEWVRGMLKR